MSILPDTETDLSGKVCTKCGEWKPVEEFYRTKDGVLGRVSRCKVCVKSTKRGTSDLCVVCGVKTVHVISKMQCFTCYNRVRYEDAPPCIGYFGECGGKAVKRMLCRSHYNDFMDGNGTDRYVRKINMDHPDTCKFVFDDGVKCEGKYWANGYCKKHERVHYYETDPEGYRDKRQKEVQARRARIAGVDSDDHTRLDTWVLRGPICYLCAEECSPYDGHANSYQEDHLIPIHLKGDDTQENCFVSCATCNNLKSSTRLITFLARKTPDLDPSPEDTEAYMELCRELDNQMYCVGSVAGFKALLESTQ